MAASGRVNMSAGRIIPQKTCLFLCDMQEYFVNPVSGQPPKVSIANMPQVAKVSNKLLRAFKLLDLPVLCTEHEGCGKTVAELGLADHEVPVFEKTTFSMCVPPVRAFLQEKQIESVVLCGVDLQVCLNHTTLDLLQLGVQVHIPPDAASTGNPEYRQETQERLRDSGAFFPPSTMVLFSLVEGTHHPSFPQLRSIIYDC